MDSFLCRLAASTSNESTDAVMKEKQECKKCAYTYDKAFSRYGFKEVFVKKKG